MARSKYIYIVRYRKGQLFLGAFTVKHEAVTFAKRYDNPLDELQLSRTEDGLYGDKTEKIIDWP